MSCGGGDARSSESMYRSGWGGVAGTNGRLIRGRGTGGLGAGTGGVRKSMVGVGGWVLLQPVMGGGGYNHDVAMAGRG